MDLLQANSQALKAMRGMDQAEAFSVRSRTVAVYIDDSKVSNVETKDDAGMALRLIKDRRMGSASSSLKPSAPRNCAERAIRAANLSPADRRLRGFSAPTASSTVSPMVVDERLLDHSADRLVDLVEAIIACTDVDIPRGLLRAATMDSAISNSNGVEVMQRRTMVYSHFTSMVDEPSPGEGVQVFHSNFLDLDPELVAFRLEESARSHAAARPFLGQETMEMILPPSQLEDMTLSSMGSALSGENVVLERSPWRERTGLSVASDTVTVTDDPSTPALLSGTHDDEGTPIKPRTLIEGGVLKGFMYDNYNGESTGNGWRREPVDAQGIHRLPVRIGPCNLSLSGGDMTLEEMIADTDNGVLVERLAWPEADPLTGRFGLELRCGHLIRKGKVVGTVKNALLAGDMFDAWTRVTGMTTEREKGVRSHLPTVRFDGARLVGD